LILNGSPQVIRSKVHFILQHLNPLNNSWEEKHFNDTPTVKMDKKTHLYTIAIRDDNSFELFIDKKSSKKGNLLTHMRPTLTPPKTIDDPTDSKPLDWVDEAKIDDPVAVKPDDWDEEAPKTIPDPKAKKPADWLDDAPAKISDPNASKPADWDDEEDGEWEAPQINNPACEKAGCGVWTPPTIKNPAYKGKWRAPKIDNPAYKGPWKARQIPNEHYFEDLTPALGMAPMAAVVVEVWTITAGIFFDNFVIAHSLDAAFAFADATFVKKSEAEGKKEKKEKKDKTKKDRAEKLKKGTAKDVAEVTFGEAIDFATEYVTENQWAVLATALAIVLALVLLQTRGKKSTKAAQPAPEPPASVPPATASEPAQAQAPTPTSDDKETDTTSSAAEVPVTDVTNE
jgi:calnexin